MSEKELTDISTLLKRGDTKDLPANLFKKSQNSESLHDQAFETKPVSYLRDCFNRFCKNKGSVVAAAIILLIILYSIIVPLASPKNYVDPVQYPNGFADDNFSYVMPYLGMFKGTGFWDGTKTQVMGSEAYKIYTLDDSNHAYIAATTDVTTDYIGAKPNVSYTVRIDTYAVGNKLVKLKPEAYNNLIDYEKEQGIYQSSSSIMKPIVDYTSYLDNVVKPLMVSDGLSDEGQKNNLEYLKSYYNQNPNIYFGVTTRKSDGTYNQNSVRIAYEDAEKTTPINLYQKDGSNNLVYAVYENGEYTVRVDYFDYFTYLHGWQPYYVFGSNSSGQDIFLRLAKGTQFSLLLGVGVSLINFLIGLIWGSMSGYYGGTVDIVMERVTDIISAIPSLVVLTVCSIQFTNNVALKATVGSSGIIILAFLVAFVFSGWIGVASTTRMQFYRFKGQEYVLASRTLGASDARLIFRHILPNAIGTLVTSSVLMIPSVIFSESSLTYLGIIDFSTSGLSSIGSLLNEGQSAGLQNHPTVLLFPCIIISLLMICFNLFGNGLRDAFNTTLKGADD